MKIDLTVKITAEELVSMFDYFVNLDVSQKGKLRLQGIWRHMKNRCYGRSYNDLSYKRNNIQVCQDWLYSFDNFYHWAMNNGYQDNLTIDRINNNLNYQPNNCRWVIVKDNTSYRGEKSRPEIGF